MKNYLRWFLVGIGIVFVIVYLISAAFFTLYIVFGGKSEWWMYILPIPMYIIGVVALGRWFEAVTEKKD